MQVEPGVPLACSLSSDALEKRLSCIRRVSSTARVGHKLEGSTLRLSYRAGAQPALEQIVTQERECCPFLEYALTRDGDQVTLTIVAPDGVDAQVRWLFDQFLSPPRTVSPKPCGCGPGACG